MADGPRMFLVDNDILLSLFLPSASLSVCEERPELRSGQNCDVALFSDGNVTAGWELCGGDGRRDDGQVQYRFQRFGLLPCSSLFSLWLLVMSDSNLAFDYCLHL